MRSHHKVRYQRQLAFLFLVIVLVVLWIEKAHLQLKASELRSIMSDKDRKAQRAELILLASGNDGVFLADRMVDSSSTSIDTAAPTKVPIPSAALPTPQPPLQTATTKLLDFGVFATAKTSCPLPHLHPHKWATRFGWGQRKKFPECPGWKRYSHMEDHGDTMDVTMDCDEVDPEIWLFDELPDKHFHRMESTQDAEIRQNELRDEFRLDQLSERVKKMPQTRGKNSTTRNIKEAYVIAKCGERFELHVRAPKRPLKTPAAKLSKNRPINMLHLMFDSTSLPALRRSGKKLVSWMEKLSNNAASPSHVYTFKHYHAVSCCSPGNQIPVYSGVMNGEGDYFVNSEPYQSSKNWLWNIARDERQMVTFWSLDNCPDKSARDYHAYPSVDVRVVAPVCLAGVLLSHTNAECLGGQTVDQHVLNGLKTFWHNYRDETKFAAIQLITPHEETEKLLIELDELVTPFFEGLEADGTLNNTVLIFWSDHGINFGRYASTHDGEVEKMFPFYNIIAPRWLMATRPDWHEALLANQDMLTTPYDLHGVSRQFLYYPDPAPAYKGDPHNPSLPLPKQSHIVSSLPHLSPFVDLTRNRLFPNRSCTEANIPMEFCTCIPWQTLSPEDSSKKSIVAKVVAQHQALLKPHSDVCQEVVFDKVESIELQKWPTEYKPKGQENAKSIWMKPNRDMLKIRYWTKGIGKGLFEAVVSIGKTDSTQFDISLHTRLDAMTKKCGIIDKVTEILCVCK